MSTDSEPHQPSFRFRDKFSRLKDRVKEKIKDKAIKHNSTLFIHQNLTSNETNVDYSHTTRHGFRQHMHHFKDVMKNKTHYESIKDKIKDKIDDKLDLHDNKTYPKGFYDSLFSPETENDTYLETAIICLWVIALLCIIPTIIIIFLPSKDKNKKPTKPTTKAKATTTTTTTSTNMIFFHVFFCELCYLTYILLAMINVAKNFRLGSTFCDIANYGMYVTIPIMQFALLFLSLERLTKNFNLSMTWAQIFTKPYLIQVILCAIWIFLIALLMTFMFIKKQFNFSFVKDQIKHFAPPILGDVVNKLASRQHHCAIDGRLSSVVKTLMIILFIILIVKPIVLSVGFNLLTPYCCKKRKNQRQNHGDRRTTNLVTIFLLLNFFFSFPFYFTSIFKSIFTNIDSTKDTFSIILKICFILRIANIIFECLAFYIFERNSWSLFSKILYYCTCKKFPIFKSISNDDVWYTKDPKVLDAIKETRHDSDDEEAQIKPKKNKKEKKTKSKIQSKPDQDDDGAFVEQSIAETPVGSDEEEPVIKPTKKRSNKETINIENDETKKMIKKKPKAQKNKVDEIINSKRKSQVKQVENDDDEEEEEEEEMINSKQKSQVKQVENDEEEEEEDDEEEKVTTTTERKSRTKEPKNDMTTKRKSHPKVEEQEKFIEKPKSKSRHHDVDIAVPNGIPTNKHSSSVPKIPKRRSTPPLIESETDIASDASQTSQSARKQTTKKVRSSSNDQKRTTQHSRHRTKPTSSHHSKKKSRHDSTTKKNKKQKKDRQTLILEMSHDV